MKNIKSNQITLRNFKGTRELTVEFGNRTQIKGDNKTGKTTIVDARSWLWEGKDSKGNTDFDIKPLDENNEPIHKLVTMVEEILQDGTKLRKEYKEIWRTKRGESEERLTGHTTDHFINDVPKSKSEYETKVASIIDGDMFRLISDLNYFNSDDKVKGLGKDGRRKVLSEMAKDPTPEEITENSTENLQKVVNLISQGKDIEDEKKRAQAQKKKSKDERKTIGPKIDENIRLKPEPLDWELLDMKLIKSEGQLKEVNEQINDVSKSYQAQADSNAELIKSQAEKQTEYSRLDTENRNTPNAELDAYYTKLNGLKDEVRDIENERDDATDERIKINQKIETVTGELNTLRSDYTKTTSSSFQPDSTECPTCKREYDNAAEQQKEAHANFNTNKAEKIRINKEKGSAKAAEKLNLEKESEAIEETISELTEKVTAKQTEIDNLAKPTAEHKPTPEMIALKSEIDAIVIPEIVKADVSELEGKAEVIQEEIDALKKQLATRDQAKKIDERIEELNQQKRTISQEIARLEQLEFAIETYQNSEMDLIEKRVNDKFAIVKFKMFEKQMNGGINQTCVAMVDGVPYKSVNTADQIKASLDIINTLQHHYQTFTLVPIDNAESITEIPPMNCQTVELYVQKGLKKLEVFNFD
jgi:exonuclease SbcC